MEIMHIKFYPTEDRVSVVVRDRGNTQVLTDTVLPADEKMRRLLHRILRSHQCIHTVAGNEPEYIVDVRDVLD